MSLPNFLCVFCFRLPDGFTQLRALAHLALNDVSLQTLPNDIGKYVRIRTASDVISIFGLSVLKLRYDCMNRTLIQEEEYLYSGFQMIILPSGI